MTLSITTICHYAKSRYAECRDIFIVMLECHNAECHFAECHYAECRDAMATFNNHIVGKAVS
jgi:hypothetical protein